MACLCPVCDSAAPLWTTKLEEGQFYPIYRCRACGYGFVSPRPSLQFLEAYYRKWGRGVRAEAVSVQSVLSAEARDPNSTIDAKRMVSTIKTLTERHPGLSRRFLDVGAGYGFFSQEAIRCGFQVTAVNPCEDERTVCRSIGGLDPIGTTFEALTVAHGSLSVVLMSQVLEHAFDVNLWISKVWQLLEPQGIVAIALPNFGSLQRLLLREREPYICPPAHLNFFTPSAVVRLLKRNGFRIEEIQHVSRIPRSTIRKRVRGMAAPLALPLWEVAMQLLQLTDALRLGSIINVYARRPAVDASCA